MKLEAIGKILAAGFGDRVAIGIFMGFLDGVTPARAYEYIKDGIQLGYWVADSDWSKYKNIAKQVNVDDITTERIVEELRKHRLDLLGVIMNTPGGNEWLDTQIIMLKKKLGIEKGG